MIGAAPVTEGDLIARFEACTLPPWGFGHREHLFVAWTYLKSAPFEDAAPRFVRNVKRFAARHGAQGKYHATVTWALLSLMAEAIDALPSHSFDALLEARPELVSARETLRARYSRAVLESERARRVPILPR